MEYKVELHPHAARQLKRLQKSDYKEIFDELIKLSKNPRPHGVVKLKNHIHRVRIGNWRVIYAIFDHLLLVSILEVLRRNERTYKEF